MKRRVALTCVVLVLSVIAIRGVDVRPDAVPVRLEATGATTTLFEGARLSRVSLDQYLDGKAERRVAGCPSGAFGKAVALLGRWIPGSTVLAQSCGEVQCHGCWAKQLNYNCGGGNCGNNIFAYHERGHDGDLWAFCNYGVKESNYLDSSCDYCQCASEFCLQSATECPDCL